MEQRTGLLITNAKRNEMEQRAAERETGNHSFCLVHRRNGKLTGILDVIAFDEDRVILMTDLGQLKIEGRELRVKKLDMESHEVELEGYVTGFSYQEKGVGRKPQESFWKRLLQ